jgi:hypothetical protein
MLTTMARSPPRSRMPSIGISVRRASVAKWLCLRTLPLRPMSNRPATTSISHEARLGGTASCLFPRPSSAAARAHLHGAGATRLVAAFRLSPPALVHTRRSGKHPVSRIPARSTTCVPPLKEGDHVHFRFIECGNLASPGARITCCWVLAGSPPQRPHSAP